MNEPNPIVVAGIDVGKSKLDVHLLEDGVDRVFNSTSAAAVPRATGCFGTA